MTSNRCEHVTSLVKGKLPILLPVFETGYSGRKTTTQCDLWQVVKVSDLSFSYGFSRNTVCQIIIETCRAIYESLITLFNFYRTKPVRSYFLRQYVIMLTPSLFVYERDIIQGVPKEYLFTK